jgi:PAS domain-containing protein
MRDPIDFQTVFDRIPSPYMMLDRDLRFVAANRAYLAAVGRDWAQLEGVGMFEAFPSGGESRRVLESSLIRARDSGQVDMLPLIHYAIQRPTRWAAASRTGSGAPPIRRSAATTARPSIFSSTPRTSPRSSG